MTLAGMSKYFLAALVFTSLMPTTAQPAQAPSTQQSTNQIYKTTGEQMAAQGQNTNKEQSKAQEQKPPDQKSTEQQAADLDLQPIVIPPAPIIVKRDPDSVSIPLGTTVPEPRFEERPAVSSSVKIGSLYGYRRDPFTRRARFHSGVDIKARWGDPVGASHPGTVQFAGWHYGYGNLVIVNHGGGVTTYYAHLSGFELGVGDKVGRGTIVGYAGSTGRATSPHLHYEVRIDDNPVNPLRPIALDPSSSYFNQSADKGRVTAPSASTILKPEN